VVDVVHANRERPHRQRHAVALKLAALSIRHINREFRWHQARLDTLPSNVTVAVTPGKETKGQG